MVVRCLSCDVFDVSVLFGACLVINHASLRLLLSLSAVTADKSGSG